MASKKTDLPVVLSDKQITKIDLAYSLAEQRFDRLSSRDQLESSAIGYTVFPIYLCEILSYFFCSDALVAFFLGVAPQLGVPLEMALPMFIYYISLEYAAKGLNREYVIKSKFKKEEMERLELPGAYHEAITKLIEEKSRPIVAEKIRKIRLELERLRENCETLRISYCALSSTRALCREHKKELAWIKKNLLLICKTRSRAVRELRAIKKSMEEKRSALSLIALEGKHADLTREHELRETEEELTEKACRGVDQITDEIDELKIRMNVLLSGSGSQ